MEDFMAELASEVWPLDKRISFCYTHRAGEEKMSCNAKEGNPFGPFWNTFNIEFPVSETYGPLHYDIHNTGEKQKAKNIFPFHIYFVSMKVLPRSGWRSILRTSTQC